MARIYAWYEQSIIDRPPVRFHHHNMQYERHRTVKGPWINVEERWLDVEFQVRTFLSLVASTEFRGETFPVFWPNLSALAYNLFLGQEAVFDDMTAWVRPCVDDLHNLPDLCVRREGRYFKTVEALTRRALDCADGRFMVGYTDMYTGVDCAAALRGAEALCLDLLIAPGQVHTLMDRTLSEYADVYGYFDNMLKRHDQPSATWINLPSFETFNVLGCDFAVNISKDHFDEFCMPILRKEAALFVHNVFHVDGPGVAKNIDSILTLPNLIAIQWAQGHGENRQILQWVPLIRKIQEAGKSVIVDLQPHELDAFCGQVDPVGVMLWVSAEPADQPDILARVAGW